MNRARCKDPIYVIPRRKTLIIYGRFVLLYHKIPVLARKIYGKGDAKTAFIVFMNKFLKKYCNSVCFTL